jgi:SAM-dependent methyltransferase
MPFSRSAHIYDTIYQQSRDYKAQAEQIHKWIQDRKPVASSLLDVACGTGLHLSFLRSWYEVAGVDISPAMLEIARARNPGVTLSIGDMRDFYLNARFDVVTCLFSTITYADTVEGLNATLANFARHLIPQGICIVEPFIPPEAWHDGRTGLRTVETSSKKIAMLDRSERDGRRVRREIAYVVVTPDRLEQIYEEHLFTLFSRAEYENAFRLAGFDIEFDKKGFIEGRGIYFGMLA